MSASAALTTSDRHDRSTTHRLPLTTNHYNLSMERMRDILRGSLARSLSTLSREDRLQAALPVVCGSVLAAHCEVAGLDSDGVLHIRVDGPAWAASLRALYGQLAGDLGRVAGVPLHGIHFTERPAPGERTSLPGAI
jgi:hypothetical protein